MASSSVTPEQIKTIGELNREWFDSKADSAYSVPWIRDLCDQIIRFLREKVEWIGLPAGHELKMLDYACGNGTASVALSPFVSILRGIDISAGMVDQYNAVARQRGLPPDQMRAAQGDLLASPPDAAIAGADWSDFHVACVCMALHHVADPAGLVRRMAERLSGDGGVLVVVDGLSIPGGGPDARVKNPAAHTVTKHGFSEAEMREMMAEAGLVDVGFVLLPEKTKLPEELGGVEMQLFVARGKRVAKP